MFMWFSEIFSSSGDVAKLVTVLITSFVAFDLLLLNQWLNKRKEIKSIKIDRIEKLGIAVNEFFSIALLYIEDAYSLHTQTKRTDYAFEQDFIQLNAKMNNSISTVKILSQLYFSYDIGIKLQSILDDLEKKHRSSWSNKEEVENNLKNITEINESIINDIQKTISKLLR